MRITSAGLTDVGLQRDHNEDSFSCLGEFDLYLVADGMGGHQSGEVASGMAAESMAAFFEATKKEDATWPFPIDPNLSLAENRLSASIKLANKQIFDRSCADPSMQGMGTTVVGALFVPERAMVHVAHVGDSRVYMIREGKIRQLTRDHSLVNDYLMMMPDMPQEAMDVLPKNVITRALGMQDSVVVDMSTEDVRSGDRFLLCSDGLCGQVADERIREVVDEFPDDLAKVSEILVKESNDAGGEDNVTVVVVAIDGAADGRKAADTVDEIARPPRGEKKTLDMGTDDTVEMRTEDTESSDPEGIGHEDTVELRASEIPTREELEKLESSDDD